MLYAYIYILSLQVENHKSSSGTAELSKIIYLAAEVFLNQKTLPKYNKTACIRAYATFYIIIIVIIIIKRVFLIMRNIRCDAAAAARRRCRRDIIYNIIICTCAIVAVAVRDTCAAKETVTVARTWPPRARNRIYCLTGLPGFGARFPVASGFRRCIRAGLCYIYIYSPFTTAV